MKASKYDVLVVKYKKIVNALAELHREFLGDIDRKLLLDDDPVDLTL